MPFLDSFTPYKLDAFTKGVRLPAIHIPQDDKAALGCAPDATNGQYLKRLCWQSLKERLKSGKIKQPEALCVDRLKAEFEVFEKTGVIDYLLLLKDIFCWCDRPDVQIKRGPGRGSACGSLALYLIGLTGVNPLDHDLNFTRFLSEARAKPKVIDGVTYLDGKAMADFDGDISFLGRPKVIKRLEHDYAGKTCKISTLQYLTGKTALKETCKSFLDMSDPDARAVSDHVETLFGKVDSLDKTYEKSKPFRQWVDDNRETFDIARGIEGLIRTSGIHASGMLVSYDPIIDIMPMQLSDSGEIVSGYDMDIALTVFVKADILGLRTLDVIEAACKEIGIKQAEIDINHQSIYDYLQTTNLFHGLFQIEDGATKEVVRKVRPKNIEQLMACLSISRPGALKYVDDYVKFVQTGEFKKVHPAIDESLLQSGGIILYQEQINDICQRVFGMSAVDADEVRRAIGKKIKADMAKWEPVLFANGRAKGIDDIVTRWFWDTCNASADYLFNKSHGAAYAYITASTAYLKANQPLAFYLGCLKMASEEADPLSIINTVQNEMPKMGLALLPPNILKSQEDYSIDQKTILMGLTAIKGISGKGYEKLRAMNRETTNKFDLFAAAHAAKVPINIMRALIMSGCLPTGTDSRARFVLELETYGLLTEREIPIIHQLGKEYAYDLLTIIKACVETLKDDKGKPLIKETRFATIKREYEDFKLKYTQNTKHAKLCLYVMETEYLGFSSSTTLKDIYKEDVTDLSTLEEVKAMPVDSQVRSVVRVSEVEDKVSKNKNAYLRIMVRDETGTMTTMLFDGRQGRLHEMEQFNGRKVVEGDIIVIHGKTRDGDVIFLDGFSIQDVGIVIKKSDLAKLKEET